jgi:hypothetical protein
MIKFFRKIRQDLLSKGKTGKYLKYAIGEIILVVIGILIALQINNWNNNSAERRLESEILNEILVNLKADLQNIEIKKKENSRFEKHNQLVYEHLKNKSPLTDSLKYHYSFLYGFGNFQPIKVGYENLKSRGLNIIKNQAIRKEISELYEYKYYFMVEDIRQAIENIQTIHKNQIITKLITKSSYASAQPINLVALQNDIQFQETLKNIAFSRRWTNDRLDEGKEEILKVIKKIENELNKN